MSLRIIVLQLDLAIIFQIPHYLELKTISLGFSLQLFTISYFKFPLFLTIFCFPYQFETAGFNCICNVKSDPSGYYRMLSEREASIFLHV